MEQVWKQVCTLYEVGMFIKFGAGMEAGGDEMTKAGMKAGLQI